MNITKIVLLLLPLALTVKASDTVKTSYPIVKLQLERLPDLNTPRAGHAVFCVNGELTVAGGHTNGFVPTPTAEYFKDGKWRMMQMVYNHDFGFSVVMKNGKVLLGGGCAEPIGIGQTFLAELYDPITHTFDGFSSMAQKRTHASGLELDSGRVVIAGNWYHKDGIEMHDGNSSFTYIKDVTEERTVPMIFRISADDALIYSYFNTKGGTLSSVVADRLKGDTMHIPLMEAWHPLWPVHRRDAECFIGDESKGQYVYLFPVSNKSGQVAIMKVENGEFSLLPTEVPVPMRSQWEDIIYESSIVVDRKAGRGYLLGLSRNYRDEPTKPHRQYVVAIDYAHATEDKGAPLTLYYTDSISFYPDHTPVLTDDGDLVLAGGLRYSSHNANFDPSAEVYMLHVGTPVVVKSKGASSWWWLLLILATLAFTCVLLIRYRKNQRRTRHVGTDGVAPRTEENNEEVLLMERINQVMEEQKLYQNSDMKLQDLAAALGTNRRFVSDCINAQTGGSFIQYVNTYRVNHAKSVLRQHPDKKIADVYMESGFANDTSFFRTFKTVTGMTPREWMNNKID